MGSPTDDPLRFGGTIILLAALLLSFAGMVMVLYSARMTRQAVVRRIDLIRPGGASVSRTVPLATALIRSGEGGSQERQKQEMVRVLVHLGIPSQHASAILTGARLTMIAVLAIVIFIGASHWSLTSRSRILPFLLAAGFGMVGWFVPAMIVSRLIKSRTKAIVAGLPDSLELLVICVEAGLSFEDGFDRVAGVLKNSQPALAEELSLTAADLKILPSRDEALAKLAERVDTPSVRSVTTTLSQTLRYGTPLARALRMVAGELRNDTLVRLQERANQLPTLMTIPMMLFIMPTIFMIVAGPAVLRIIDQFKHH